MGTAPHLASVSKALLTAVKGTWLQESVTGWFVSVSELLGLPAFEAVN